MFFTIQLFLVGIRPGSDPGGRTDEEVYVRVNQIGYRTDDAKVAVAFSRAAVPDRIAVVDTASDAIVSNVILQPVDGTWATFTQHARIDLSAIHKPGRYRLRAGETASQVFAIGDQIYDDVPDQLLSFMRAQRCGYNPALDAVCHRFDGRTAYGPMPAGTYVDATGGWHDAGDQLKYLLTAGNATAQLLLAFALNSAPFIDRVNALGQMGANGVPDVLDEARWGLDWMLKLHPAPDQLYHQVADDRDHTGWRLPQDDRADYGWGPGTFRVVYFADGRPQGLREFKSESTGIANLAGRYAAAMALGYQIWKNDPRLRAYAARLLEAGKEVYQLGAAHEGVQQGNSYGAPYRYEESTWADDMEWGAAELHRATGERRYLNDAKRYAEIAAATSWTGREQTNHYEQYPFVNMGHFRLYDLVDTPFRRKLAGYYRETIDRAVAASTGNPYRIGVPFIWCSNNLVVALATLCLLYEGMTGDRSYRAFAIRHRDWLLGVNPWGVSMFTGIPANGAHPTDVHLPAHAVLKRAARGGLVDGPVYRRIFDSLKGVGLSHADSYAAFQDARAVYHDDINDYSTNEPTMDGTASAVLLLALR